MTLDLAGLRTIRAVADAGSFTGAARALGYSQPAISQQVRRMEARLGTALVERTGRAVRLTEAGQVVARHAATALTSLAAATEEVAALAGLRAGRVRLVAFPSATATIVPRALRLLRDLHPGVTVRLVEAEPPESLALLRTGECDVVLTFAYGDRGAEDLGGLAVTPLLRDPLQVVVPPGHPAANGSTVSLRQLADQTWIAGCPRCRGHLLALCAAAGFTPNIAYETDDYVAVLGLVAAEMGVALLPALVLGPAGAHAVVTRPLTPASEREVVAVTSPDLLRVPAVSGLLAGLREVTA